MNCHNMDIIAGMLSSIIFASGTVSMLMKVIRTQDVDSYSLSSIILNNLGNLVYLGLYFQFASGTDIFPASLLYCCHDCDATLLCAISSLC